MSNPIVDYFRQYIGQELTESPSPVTLWLRGVLDAADPGKLVISFTVRKDMTNPLGTLHGGVIAAIMDDVIGATVYSLQLQKPYITINLQVDYLASASIGEQVTARSRIIRKGNTVVYAECDLVNTSDELLARGTSHLVAPNTQASNPG